jgi:hypothetical protein
MTDHHDHITPPRHIYTMRSALDSMIGCIQCREPHVLFHRTRFVVGEGMYRITGGDPNDPNFLALLMLYHANTAKYDHELHQLGPRA